jgi:ABC-2 family transporter protein
VIRLTLRQFRAEAIVAIGLLAAFGIVLLVTGAHLAEVNGSFERACKAAGDCASAPNPVLNVDTQLQNALPLIVLVAPALVGIFFGAPLIAREFEAGTFRLAWTQSVTRGQWLAAKLAVVGLAAMVLGGLATWMVDWWARPLDAANENRFGLANFGLHGVAPLGYAAFAFALGVTSGVLLRRSIAAMAATLAGFIGARLAGTFWIRPRLAAPLHETLSLTAPAATPGFGVAQPGGIVSLIPPTVGIPNGWVYSSAVVDKAGAAPTSSYLLHTCPMLRQLAQAGPGGPPTAVHLGGSLHVGPGIRRPDLQACLQHLATTFHTVVTYQPASRFWPFQWAEMGIFLAAALALCALTFSLVRRHHP